MNSHSINTLNANVLSKKIIGSSFVFCVDKGAIILWNIKLYSAIYLIFSTSRNSRGDMNALLYHLRCDVSLMAKVFQFLSLQFKWGGSSCIINLFKHQCVYVVMRWNIFAFELNYLVCVLALSKCNLSIFSKDVSEWLILHTTSLRNHL